MRSALFAIVLAACGGGTAAPQPIRFLHTFSAYETELFNSTMVERGLAVEGALVPFARGQQVISEILRAGKACPDLLRIDATWLPGIVAAKLLVPPPDELTRLDWTPEATSLAQVDGRWWSIPQVVDGLIVVRDTSTPPPSGPSLDALVAAARAARSPKLPSPLSLRVDGYWLVPWLRAQGAELTTDGIAGDGAVRALAKFADLFGEVAATPPTAGTEAPDEQRRWEARQIAYWVTGPWQLGALKDRDRISVSPLAHAPRGGQLLVVPACAEHPDQGWRLASELTSVTVELIFADAFATVPTRRAVLDSSQPLVHALVDAFRTAEMLPRSPLTPLLFDDLNPALAAVVAGDATAGEAIEGVRRGWKRLEVHP